MSAEGTASAAGAANRRRRAAALCACAVVIGGAVVVATPFASPDVDETVYQSGQPSAQPLAAARSVEAEGTVDAAEGRRRLERLRGLALPDLKPKPPAPPPIPGSSTMDPGDPKKERPPELQQQLTDAAHALRDLQRSYASRGCAGPHIPRTKHATVLYDRKGSAEEILDHMLRSTCALRTKMREFGLKAPLFVDVGAGPGRAARRAAELGCRVVAFEPRAESAQRVRQVLGNRSTVDVRQVAVFNESGLRRPFRAATDLRFTGGDALKGTRSSYEPGDWWHSRMKYDVIEVDTVTLDDALPAAQEPLVGVMAIDVRGWEMQALEGAADLLSQHRIQNLLFRLWPAGMDVPERDFPREQVVALLQRLHYLGYTLHQTDCQSMHIKESIQTPDCAVQLVDFLSDARAFDAFGLWVDVVAVK